MTYPIALTQTHADPKMTDRYSVINTSDVIEVMKDQGFNVHSYRVDNSRKVNRDFARHMVVFRNNDLPVIDDCTSQFIWTNSHNGRCAGKMRGGLYRFVCANGLVIGNDLFEERMRHSKSITDQLIERVRHLSANSLQTFQKIEEWSKIELNKDQVTEFAQKALVLRFGEERSKSYSTESILSARRAEDEGYDLWKTFNRIQENSMKGGFTGYNSRNRQVRSRSIEGITQDVFFNEKLWSLAESIAN